MSKTFQTRISQKHDTEENWIKATNFSPLEGEIIIYDIDTNHSTPRFKVGDGITNVNNLPFISAQAFNIYLDTPPDNAPIGSLWLDNSIETILLAEEQEGF